MEPDQRLPDVYSGGRLERYTAFPARHVAPRTVDVWLPPGYAADADRRYAVLYMHDGQNLFDPALAYTGIDWGMDEAVARLMAEGVTPGAIVVGVWNGSMRTRDYMPARPLQAPGAATVATRFAQEQGGPPASDAYLRFLVEEVKPCVDAAYRTHPDQPHTFVMGSSMGGLLSLYAISEYPQVFGGAGCLSTHWPIGGMPLVAAMAQALPPAATHYIYFDHGTAGLDGEYAPLQAAMDAQMAAAGYQAGVNWITHRFEGAEHNEAAWRARVDVPLRFLLGAQLG